MKRRSITTVVFLLVFLLLSGPVLAAVPWLISYQGKVTDSEQVPLDGSYTMIFRLYSFEGATSPIWAEEQTVSVTDGVFQVQLGTGANLVGGVLNSTLIAGQDRWLEIEIEGEALSPRQRLTSGAYALRAETADSALRIVGALPSRITTDDEGYALSVSNSGSGGAANLDGFVNVDHGNLLVQGDGSFDANGEAGALYLGDSMNYIKAVHGSGVSIGTFDAADAIVVEQGTGNVGIGTSTPAARLDVAGRIHASGTLEIGSDTKNLAIFTDGGVVDIMSTGAALGINYPGVTDTVINVNGGRVGIGVDPPSEKLSVNGTVESTSGGFKFPDGSSQASAGASQSYVSALEARIALLETKMAALESLLTNVTRSGNEITFSGVNVHIVNGTGTTDGEPNTYGNLIVGYNELRTEGINFREGSHNVIVGSGQNHSAYGGLVVGENNTISGNFASVSGGSHNTASGNNASISGGSYNTASGEYSFVGGGGGIEDYEGNVAFANYSAILGGRTNGTGDISVVWNEVPSYYYLIPGSDHGVGVGSTVTSGSSNIASSPYASVSGGASNTASEQYASVSGGINNTASGWGASVSGGMENNADGHWSSISGGGGNSAEGSATSVSGGTHNRAGAHASCVGGGSNNYAHGEASFVGGGGGEASEDGNVAFSHFSTIIGGKGNLVGDPNLINNYIGYYGTIAGGESNRASGDWSIITGGLGNVTETTGNHANVTGGAYNTAVNSYATVSGGYYNTASGASSSVSGGYDNTAVNAFDSVVGDVDAVYVDNTPVH